MHSPTLFLIRFDTAANSRAPFKLPQQTNCWKTQNKGVQAGETAGAASAASTFVSVCFWHEKKIIQCFFVVGPKRVKMCKSSTSAATIRLNAATAWAAGNYHRPPDAPAFDPLHDAAPGWVTPPPVVFAHLFLFISAAQCLPWHSPGGIGSIPGNAFVLSLLSRYMFLLLEFFNKKQQLGNKERKKKSTSFLIGLELLEAPLYENENAIQWLVSVSQRNFLFVTYYWCDVWYREDKDHK